MGENAAELAFPDYWNRRYTEEEGKQDSYDWFRTWEHLEAWFKNHLSGSNARILHLGCGNSVSTFTFPSVLRTAVPLLFHHIFEYHYRPQNNTLFILKYFGKFLL